jgi:hypothetical protein
MMEVPNPASRVPEQFGTWLAQPSGYSDFVLRGPWFSDQGAPGPLHVRGVVIPFTSFLPGALLWASETGGDLVEATSETARSERTLVGSFEWAGKNYQATFVYFEDYPYLASVELLAAAY